MHRVPNDHFQEDDPKNPLAFVVPNFWTSPLALSGIHPKLTIYGNLILEKINEINEKVIGV